MVGTENAMLRVGVAQVTPVFMDRSATVTKACAWIAQAGQQGVKILAFPESFIPGYPDWVWAVPAGDEGELNQLYAEFVRSSPSVPGPEVDQLCQAAREAGVCVVMGMSERNVEASGGSLYNSLVYISADGRLLGKHRKLVPTGGERLVWAQGDGSTLAAYDTPFGRLGGLICWENYMPLARYAMYAWGVQIYVAATWDRGDVWQSTLRHIAKEGRMLVLSAGMPLRVEDIPDRLPFKRRYSPDTTWINSGDSAIISPEGEVLAGPLRDAEGLLCADLDPAQLIGPKWMLDVAGHYARPDVFTLRIHQAAHPMIRAEE